MENSPNSKKITQKPDLKVYGFSTVLSIALLFTGVLSLFLMYQLNTGSTVISKHWLPSVIIAEELNNTTSDFRIAEISHVVSHDNVDMYQYEATLFQKSGEIDLLFQAYMDNYVTNEEDLAMLSEAQALWETYLSVHNEMIAYSRNNDTTEAMDIMENQSEDLFNEVSATFSDLVVLNKNGADQASLNGDAIFYGTSVVFLLLFFISIAFFRKFKTLMMEIETTQEHLKQANEEALLQAEKLSSAHDEALLASQAKSNFLANMSHEIRTPMNAISGMTDIILRETTNSDVKEYGMNIKRACDSLLGIINDVLDISKIESGKLEIIETEYLLSNVLKDVLSIASNRLEHTELMFITNFQQNLPENIIGDDVRVKQVMVNILNNAIKFTQEGHISFRVWGDCSNGQLKLSFSVTDTGMGISPEDMDKLFASFERINTTKNRSIEGTGLGLAITKRLCEMMDGNVEVSSEIGKGTTFTVTLIQQYRENTVIAQVEEEKSVLLFESRELYRETFNETCRDLSISTVVSCGLQSEFNEALQAKKFDFIFTSSMYHHKVKEMVDKLNLSSQIVLLADNFDVKTKFNFITILMPIHCISVASVLNGNEVVHDKKDDYFHFRAPNGKILLVDDNHVNLIVAQGLMKPYQFEIDTAENGEEAVKAVKKKEYDLVFMDHMMPVMDGIDATIAIRGMKGDYFKNLPIIALTANALVGTQETFLKEGMNDFLAKPIQLDLLNEVLQKWLPKELQVPVNNEETPTIEEPTPVVETPNSDVDLKISGVDVPLGLQRVGGDFSIYLKILGTYYHEGIKLIQNISKNFDDEDFHHYKIQVHALKSSSAAIGAMELSEQARLLEEASNNDNSLYIHENHYEFVETLTSVLENIRESLKGHTQEDQSPKDTGDIELYQDTLRKLAVALDSMDIKRCDVLIEELTSYHWDEVFTSQLAKISEFVSDYEYDDAVDFINSILDS
ncbi:MAG: ATP-binding protein [Eubacteriales bacterium]